MYIEETGAFWEGGRTNQTGLCDSFSAMLARGRELLGLSSLADRCHGGSMCLEGGKHGFEYRLEDEYI